MSEKINPNPQPEDVSLGEYGRYETMAVPGALSAYRDQIIQGQEIFNRNPNRMQILNTVAGANDTQINAWATLMAHPKTLENIDFYVHEAKRCRRDAQGSLGEEDDQAQRQSGPPLVQ